MRIILGAPRRSTAKGLEDGAQTHRKQRVLAAEATGGTAVVSDRDVIEKQIAAELSARKHADMGMKAIVRVQCDVVVLRVSGFAPGGQDHINSLTLDRMKQVTAP